jgi:hypothetical protein
MLYIVKPSRIYDPETVAIMAAAFDQACRSLLASADHDEAVRRRLAEQILRRVDRGERDPTVIATAVMEQLTGIDGR